MPPDAKERKDRWLKRKAHFRGICNQIERRYRWYRQKDVALLEAAYDDKAKVTAAFNKNALVRLNAETEADFDLDAFEHEARWNDEHKRIEMHLRSTKPQTVQLGDATITFAKDETIHTESCHKYGPDGVVPLTDRYDHVKTWTDADDRFGIQFLAVRP